MTQFLPKASTQPTITIHQRIAYFKAFYSEKTVFHLVKVFKWYLYILENDENKRKISFLNHGWIFRRMVLQALDKGRKQETKKILDLQSWQSQGNRGFLPTPGPRNVIRSTCDYSKSQREAQGNEQDQKQLTVTQSPSAQRIPLLARVGKEEAPWHPCFHLRRMQYLLSQAWLDCKTLNA